MPFGSREVYERGQAEHGEGQQFAPRAHDARIEQQKREIVDHRHSGVERESDQEKIDKAAHGRSGRFDLYRILTDAAAICFVRKRTVEAQRARCGIDVRPLGRIVGIAHLEYAAAAQDFRPRGLIQ
jgi:hypothetical protein